MITKKSLKTLGLLGILLLSQNQGLASEEEFRNPNLNNQEIKHTTQYLTYSKSPYEKIQIQLRDNKVGAIVRQYRSKDERIEFENNLMREHLNQIIKSKYKVSN